jgi:hypothetical protein
MMIPRPVMEWPVKAAREFSSLRRVSDELIRWQ